MTNEHPLMMMEISKACQSRAAMGNGFGGARAAPTKHSDLSTAEHPAEAVMRQQGEHHFHRLSDPWQQNFLSEPVARQVVCEKAFVPRDNLRMPGSHSFSYQAEEKNRRPSELSMEDIDTDHLMRREAGVPNPQRPFGRLLPTARFVERPLAT